MSFIIGISKAKYFYDFKKPRPRPQQVPPSRQPHITQKSNYLGITISEALKLQQIHFCTRTNASGQSFITTEQFDLGRSMGGLLTFRVGAVEGHIDIKVDIVSNGHSYFKLQSVDQRIFINRALSSLKNAGRNSFFKVGICMVRGIIKLTLPLHYLLQVASLQNSSNLRKTAILRKFIDLILSEARSLAEFVARKDEGKQVKGNSELFRLRNMMHLFKEGREASEVMSEKSIREYKAKQIKSINHFVRNKVANGHQLTSLRPYILPQPQDCDFNNQSQCAFNSYQMDLLKKMAIPSRKVHANESYRAYTMNRIILTKAEEMKLKPLNSGGFSSICLAQVEYTLADVPQHQQRPQKAVMIVKKEVNSAKKQASRNQREKTILQKMKNSTSFMLNRYYLPVNLPQKSKTDIFMDYIPSLTLKELMQVSRNYLSLHSKLVILLSVVQALRSIDKFNIVHLDLKPSNIMISAQLEIKLLDFGESYHPDVPKCKPGFTIPYGCPEIHSGHSSFTVKSDVYSLAILIFEVLFKKYPFYFHKDTNINKYKTQQYLQHWMWCPEESLRLGQASIYETLSLMISRCLSKDEGVRPQLLNIGLILQQCINMVQT